MIQSYDDLYITVQSAMAEYAKGEDAAEIVFKTNDNGTCELKNKANSKKFILMFARYGDEYKVGYAYFEPDAYGGFSNPEWIEDISHDEFTPKFVITLINEHLLENGVAPSDW
ncbi:MULTISPECIES: hypothetical protein [Thiomicrorhabdus]|uniref:Uncharacterized protein n=1 Tax=Thiomicrorhabdus heinhorstiae TaxID=2748010 RepID=A0ABS0BSC4_9GAMM|nr:MULTISPECIES: hypothetical protein [Thiomicrorhabdus]MBF6056719.1 hypothetical protein [Thiomicrorhabdus heinhorstiae]